MEEEAKAQVLNYPMSSYRVAEPEFRSCVLDSKALNMLNGPSDYFLIWIRLKDHGYCFFNQFL